MLRNRPLLVEALTALGLIVAPFILGALGASPDTVNRVLVWGLFGIGFDILFGFTGLLSFGQSAFFGTGGMVAAYLLTRMGVSNVFLALIVGMVAAAIVGYFIGLIALRRTRSGPYGLEQARTLEQLEAAFEVVPLAAAVAEAFPRIDVSEEEAGRIGHGQRLVLDIPSSPAGVFAPDGRVIAVVEERRGVAQPLCVFE